MLHSLQKLQRHVVLLCLYGMLSRIVIAFVVAVLLPESECKGTAFFLPTKLFQTFFQIFFQKAKKATEKQRSKCNSCSYLKHSAECRKRIQSNGKKLNLPNISTKKIEEF